MLAKRKLRGNLLPQELQRQDVLRAADGTIWLQIRSSKTDQHGEHQIQLPIPVVDSNIVCPATAMQRFMNATKTCSPDAGLFGWYTVSGAWHPMTHTEFVQMLKDKLREIGIDPTAYAGHSLRRGGATFGFSHAGLHVLIIKAMGNWVSSAFMEYCETEAGLRQEGATRMAAAVQRIFPRGTPTAKYPHPHSTADIRHALCTEHI